MSRHRHVARWVRSGCAALLFAGLTLTTADVAAAAPAPAAWATTCDTSAAESAGYRAVRGIDLPTQANWLGVTPPYAFDDTASVADGFDRVGYCLELTGPEGSTWVWTSMEALDDDAGALGLPTRAGQVRQRYVDDLTVASNHAGVPAVDGGAGWVEMWPNQYSAPNTRQVPGASSTVYDADDTVSTTLGYGSFQVHAFTDPAAARGPRSAPAATATPVLAVNAFASATRVMDIGIGPSAGQHPDWTFSGSAATYTTRRLTVYARPAAARIDAFPSSRQLVPRPGRSVTQVPVKVDGERLAPDVTAVELRSTRDGRTSTQRVAVSPTQPRFSFTVRLPVTLASTDLELWALSPEGDRRIARAADVVAGDVYLVQGQSNAVATQFTGSSEADRSRWIRTFGSPSADPALGTSTDGWSYAVGDTSLKVGSVGQWSLRMAQLLSAERQVPVAVVNGALGGRPIEYFARNDAQPTDPATNYGRLLQRLTAAGLARPGAVDALLWYQGEADRDNADHHVTGFRDLVADWRQDLAGDLRVYVHQVRTSPCNNSEMVALRDAQRRLPDSIDNLRVLSTTDLNGHDGCHYSYAEGYRRLGEHNAAVLARDLYGVTRPGVHAPDPRVARRVPGQAAEILVALRAKDTLTVETGAAADFRVPGAVVQSVRFDASGALVLTLDRAAPAGATVAYVGHLRAGPRITTAAGVGLLAFQLPVT